MTPKFEVGEVVVLQSATMPELSGEYTVMKHLGLGHALNTDKVEFGYELTIECPGCLGWAESSLRKKHEPGTLSFRDLVQTLKDPSKCQNA